MKISLSSHPIQDENGNKIVNEYVRECRIGAGSYGKVVLYQSRVDGSHYAIKVLIMKTLNHPNIFNLVEVMDDPDADNFYMVLEYVDGSKWACEGCGPQGGVGENTARKYLRDIISGLMYLHSHIGDARPLYDMMTITLEVGDDKIVIPPWTRTRTNWDCQYLFIG